MSNLEGTVWRSRTASDKAVRVVSDTGRGAERKLLMEDVSTGRRHRTSAMQLDARYRRETGNGRAAVAR